MRLSRFLATSGLGVVLITGTALAQSSTQEFSYDALGRLVSAKTTGGQNNNQTHSICYDAAGNRVQYTSDLSGTPVACSPAPAPTPTPTPTSSSIQITDSNLVVLPAHSATYTCASGTYDGFVYAYCLAAVGETHVYVYNVNANPSLDTGYSLPVSGQLWVESSHYGTGVAP